MIQLVLPTLRAQQSGRIIDILSIGVTLENHGGAGHPTTNVDAEGLSDSLQIESSQCGIGVVVIQTSAIRREWSKIAQRNLFSISSHSGYGDLARKHAFMLERFDSRGSFPRTAL